jgi:hypothetical protein
LPKNAESEQIEAGTAIHLPLDQLQAVNLTFHHTVAPGESQRLSHGFLIALQAPGVFVTVIALGPSGRPRR